MSNVTMNQVEVKKTVFVAINGVEKRAKVLSKVEDIITVQLYDGNKLQKNDDNTPIKTEISLDMVSLVKTATSLSKTNTYDVTKAISIEVEAEEGFEATETEVEVIASGVSYKEGMKMFKEAEGNDGDIIELVKTFDAKTKIELETVSKTRSIGTETAKAKTVKAVYGVKLQEVGAEPIMLSTELNRTDALASYKAEKTTRKDGDKITLITISDTTGAVVNKDTYPTFVVGAKKDNVKKQYIVNVNGKTEVKDLTYNETRKEFTSIKKDSTLEGGSVVEMILLSDEKGEVVNIVKFSHTVDMVVESEPIPTDVVEEVVSEDENPLEDVDLDAEIAA